MPNTWRAILATSNVSSSRILQASIWYLGSTFSCTWVAHQVVITTVGLLHPRQRSNSSTPSSPSFFSSSSSPSWSQPLTHYWSQIPTPQAPLPSPQGCTGVRLSELATCVLADASRWPLLSHMRSRAPPSSLSPTLLPATHWRSDLLRFVFLYLYCGICTSFCIL